MVDVLKKDTVAIVNQIIKPPQLLVKKDLILNETLDTKSFENDVESAEGEQAEAEAEEEDEEDS